MKLRKVLLWVFVVVGVSTVVQGSLLLKSSLLRPRIEDTCFTCRAGDRPFAYPLVKFLVKMKDMVVKGINVVMASAKDFKLDKSKD